MNRHNRQSRGRAQATERRRADEALRRSKLPAGHSRDASQRQPAESGLRESQARARRKLESSLQPETGVGQLELADLIDAPSVQWLMDNFYGLAGIPMAIIDLEGKVLVGVGWQKVCTDFHRAHPASCRHCIESDTQLTVGVTPGEFRLYKCKNHMWDIASPILVAGQQVGNIFSGQFFFEGETLDYDLFRAQARQYGFDEAQYLAALEAVPRLSRKTVERAMAFFIQLAQMLSESSYNNLKVTRVLAEREALTASLSESEQRLNRAQEIAHLGSWELDLTTNRLSWSDEVYRIFGLEPQAFGATYEAFLEAVHPEDRRAVDEAYSGSLREGRDSYEIEHRVLRKSPNEVRIVHEKCEHVRDGSGRIIRSIGMVHDITERKRAQEKISLQNALLQGINRVFQEALTCQTEEELGQTCLQVASQITRSEYAFIGELDAQGQLGVIAISNPGWEACQIKVPAGNGQMLHGFKVHGVYGRVILDGQGFFTNDPASHPDRIGLPPGHPPLKAFLGVPLLSCGKTIGLVAVANREGGYRPEDQQALESLSLAIVQALLHKRAEAALHSAQVKLKAHAEELERVVAQRTAKLQETVAELEHFSYAITHDMRAPLRAMQGFASLLEDECAGCTRSQSQEYFKRIRIATGRMDQLITDSLNYSKAVRQQLVLEPVDLVRLLNSLVTIYPNLHPEKADIQIAPDLPRVMGNEAALTQCFSNLLSNAVKFAKPGRTPRIRVWAEQPNGMIGLLDKGIDGTGEPAPVAVAPSSINPPIHSSDPCPLSPCVRVWVEDDGIGIAQDDLTRIFGIFERGSRRYEGTGIGLAIVRKVAQRMGGEVGVESELGVGSRFWVELKPAPVYTKCQE